MLTSLFSLFYVTGEFHRFRQAEPTEVGRRQDPKDYTIYKLVQCVQLVQ